MQVSQFVYPFKIRFSDTDAYGIVHHSKYYCYFEEARYEFAKQRLKLFHERLEETKLKFPVISSSCEYRHAISYSLEELYIILQFHVIENCKVEFLYEVKNADGSKTYAKGRTVHAIVENGKLCLSAPAWLVEIVRQNMGNV